MLRLADGVTAEDALASIANGEQPEGEELEFFGVVGPGQEMTFDYDLDAGSYVIACFIPDLENGGVPHVAEGMVHAFTVTA